MTTCTDHQLFIFREKLWIFLSVLEVGNLSLFTTFKKQFGLGRWKKGPPRIEHSIHSNIPRLNISLLQFREFPLHTMCAQWWPLIRSRGIQDVQMCRTAAYSWRFIMIHIHSYHIHIQIHQHLKALCLMLCMQFYPLDLNQTKGSGKSWRCPYLSDIAARFQSLATAHHESLFCMWAFWSQGSKCCATLCGTSVKEQREGLGMLLRLELSFTDAFRARPIGDEEEGFAENPTRFCSAAVSLDISRNTKIVLFLCFCDWGFKP